MSKVFVVTRGSYSDYGISGIFTTRKLAQAFIASFKKGYNEFNDIETWTLNPFEIALKKGYKPYFLRIDKKGNTSNIKITDNSYGFEENMIYGFDVNNHMYLYTYALSPEHAIKIANEKRIQILAKDKWPKDKRNPSLLKVEKEKAAKIKDQIENGFNIKA